MRGASLPKALICNHLEAEAFKLKAKGRETAVSRGKDYPGIKETMNLLSN